MKPIQKFSKELPFIKEIERLKKEVDSHRPLNKDIQNKVLQKLRLDWNYNTNAIEGNSFTRGETVSLLMEGITAKGKPLKDALDIKGHNEAIDIVFLLLKEERELNEADIRSLHKIVLGDEYYNPAKTADGKNTRKLIKPGQYKTSPNHVETSTGAIHYYASVEDTPVKMKELVEWYNDSAKLPNVNPVVLAALFHHRFVAIHPFDDGNGRMTRLLTNYILLKFGYPISVVKQEKRREYYGALAQADSGELIPIIELISETVNDSIDVFLKAINGEDINETDDIDKEIDLLIKKLGNKNVVSDVKSDSSLYKIFEKFLINFSNILINYSKKFDILFYENLKVVNFDNSEVNIKDHYLILGVNEDVDDDEIDLHYIASSEFELNIKNGNEIIGPEVGEYLLDFKTMEISFDWNGFLKNSTQNNLNLTIQIIFEEYKFKIRNLSKSSENEDLYYDYYHKIPDSKEIEKLTTYIIKEYILNVIDKWN